MALLDPPPGFGLRQPVIRTLSVGARLVRIYDPTQHNTQPLTFVQYGPRNRFDHHRPIGSSPWNDPDRGIYYAAKAFSCCIAEIFGDTRIIDRPHLRVAMPSVTRKLRLLDLRGAAAMGAGTIAALSGHGDRALTQAWSRYFYEEPSLAACDGLLYHGAHNAQVAYALYERARDGLTCSPGDVCDLNEPWLRPELLRIALEHGMDVFL
ncbi:MAG: RES family NAD+ phosphorylase [Capsulimonas sp.]|uniref:RES family NAD+ phosphorylase n=1 Tax=Capsulimonas sp. TaxID=2494211 RepID=UPI0032662DE4